MLIIRGIWLCVCSLVVEITIVLRMRVMARWKWIWESTPNWHSLKSGKWPMSFILFVASLVAICNSESCDEPTRPDADVLSIKDRQELVVSGFLANASKLRQGIYEVNGSIRHSDGEGHVVFDGTVSIFSAFNFDEDIVRFDRSETALNEVLRQDAGKTLVETDKVLAGGKMITWPDRSIIWLRNPSGQPIVTSSPTMRHAIIRPVDPRCYGLGSWKEVENYTWSDIQAILRRPAVDVVSGDNGQVTIVWQFRAGSESRPQGPTIRREVVFDKSNGYCPIHFETANGLNADGTWRRTPGVTDVEWKHEKGAWVPTSVLMQRRSASDSQIADMKFNWVSINESGVASDYLTPDAFNLPETLNHIDVRLGGVPIMLDRTNAEQPMTDIPKQRGNGSLFLLLSINVASVSILLFFFYHQRRKNKTTGK